MSAMVGARPSPLRAIVRMNFVDTALWAMRILVLAVAVVIGGTVGTLKNPVTGSPSGWTSCCSA